MDKPNTTLGNRTSRAISECFPSNCFIAYRCLLNAETCYRISIYSHDISAKPIIDFETLTMSSVYLYGNNSIHTSIKYSRINHFIS